MIVITIGNKVGVFVGEEKIIIFGLEQFADTMYDLLSVVPGKRVVAFCVDEAYIPTVTEKRRLPIIPFEKLEEYYSPDEVRIIFCIGYTRMNKIREIKMKEAKKRGYKIESYTHPTALIQAASVGEGNIFMEGVIIGNGVTIGDGNIFWPAAHIAHHTMVGNYNFFTISVAVAGNIVIHDHCVFGANCTVKNGVEIAEGTLAGAGSYISFSTEKWSVYAPPKTYKLEGKSSLDFKL